MIRCLKMTSPKARYLFVLATFLLLSFVPTVAEVVRSVSDCDEFLLEKTLPQVPGVLEGGNILNQNRYKPICQTYKNQRRFLTLYDTKNKIPVFSAYKYRGGEGRRPQKHWKIEPQLDNEDDKNMIVGEKNKTYNNQAGNNDYRNNRWFDRGHLFPSAHAFNRSDKISTFTLTNIVPQAKTFNQGSWNRMESCIKCVMDKYCINNNGVSESFVVTGAQPGNNILNNRVNVPSMLWTAFCCYSSNMNMWVASAHWSDNVPDNLKNKYLQAKTLAELQEELQTADSEFNVFPATQCPFHSTVTGLYPEISKNCSCPTLSTNSTPASSTSASQNTTSGPPSTTPVPWSTYGTLPTASAKLPTTSGAPPTTSLFTPSGIASPTSGPSTTTSGPLLTTPAPIPNLSGPL